MAYVAAWQEGLSIMQNAIFHVLTGIRSNLKPLSIWAIIASSSAMAQQTFAQQVEWQLTAAKGHGALASGCNLERIQTTAAGDNASLVFESLKVDLAESSRRHGAHASGYCDISMTLVIPRSQYLTAMSAQLLGGIIKSRGAFSFLDVSYHLTRLPRTWQPAVLATGPWGQIMHGSRIFNHRDTFNEPLFTIDSSRTFNRAQQRQMCRWTETGPVSVGFKSRISVVAVRSRLDQSNILNIDGIDNTLGISTGSGLCP
jgi:hypothetical protein